MRRTIILPVLAGLCLATPVVADDAQPASEDVKLNLLMLDEEEFFFADANRDGFHDPGEFTVHSRMLFKIADADRDGKLSKGEAIADGAADGNKDGVVYPGEFETYVAGVFQAADSDGDGKLSMAEASAK